MLMLRQVALAAALLAALVSGAFGQTGSAKPKSTLTSEVGQQFPDNTSNLITPAMARQAFVDFIASWQQAPFVNAQTGTSYSVQISDFGGLVTLNNALPISVVLPNPTGAVANLNVYVADIGTGSATISAVGATINGAPSVTLPSGSYMWFVSDGSGLNYRMVQNGTTPAANSLLPSMLASSSVPYGTPMLNGKLVASVNANALTIALKTLAGVDPSAGDPTWILVPNGTGGYTPIEQTSALSITVPSGGSLGTVNAQAGRIWVGIFNNSGAAVVGVYNSLNATGPTILSWDETSTASGTGVSAGSTNSQTWYTSGAVTANFRVVGAVEFTEATAGTWATAPSKVMLFGPGVARPGTVLQEVFSINTSSETPPTSATFAVVTACTVTASIQSAANVMRVESNGSMFINGTANGNVTFAISRGTTNNTNMLTPQSVLIDGNTVGSSNVPVTAYDTPNTTGSLTYQLQSKSSNASVTNTYQANSTMSLKEIQI
jgi:hypothetical protein